MVGLVYKTQRACTDGFVVLLRAAVFRKAVRRLFSKLLFTLVTAVRRHKVNDEQHNEHTHCAERHSALSAQTVFNRRRFRKGRDDGGIDHGAHECVRLLRDLFRIAEEVKRNNLAVVQRTIEALVHGSLFLDILRTDVDHKERNLCVVVPRDGAGRAAVHGRRLHVFQKILLALFVQIIEVKNGVRVIGRFLRYGYGIAVCRNNLRRGPVFLHFLDLLARVQNACLAPRGIARRGIDGKHRRALGDCDGHICIWNRITIRYCMRKFGGSVFPGFRRSAFLFFRRV